MNTAARLAFATTKVEPSATAGALVLPHMKPGVGRPALPWGKD